MHFTIRSSAVKALSKLAVHLVLAFTSDCFHFSLCVVLIRHHDAGVEMFKKSLNEGQAGDNVGLLLRGIQRDDVVRGQVVCKPGSVTPHKKFKGEIYALTKEEGGRHTPFFTNYKPQFFFRTADITGEDTQSLSGPATERRWRATTWQGCHCLPALQRSIFPDP